MDPTARIALCALWVAGFAAAVPSPAAQAPGSSEQEREREMEKERDADREKAEREEPDRITGPLTEILHGSRKLEELRLRVEWVVDREIVSLALYGDGVAIWRNRSQFRVPRRDLLAVVADLERSGVGKMRSRYGDEESERLSFQGRLSVSVGPSAKNGSAAKNGAAAKNIVQLMGGEQSRPLALLADRLLAVGRAGAPKGISASTLDDGLRKVASGELAPETLEVVFQRRDDRALPNPENGWLLRVEADEAVVREFRPGRGYAEPRRRALPAEEFRRLVETLRAAEPGAFGSNLFAPRYTDLRISVLDRTKDVQARRYLGVTAETHGKVQEAFDRLVADLEALARTTLAEGKEE